MIAAAPLDRPTQLLPRGGRRAAECLPFVPRLGSLLLLTLALPLRAGAARPWQVFYEGGTWAPGATGWIGDDTHSKRTDEGLLVSDPSIEKGSGRMYSLNWHADPARGAALEARVRAVSCSQPWGSGLMVADGVHEESLTIYADKLQLVNAKETIPFDAAKRFHTYRLVIKGEDLTLFADGKELYDGAGKFVTPAQLTPPRNQCGFGCGASAAMGEAVWEWVRFQSDLPEREAPTMSEIPGLEVEFGETVEILPNATYRSLFMFGDSRLAVGDRHSADHGKTWQPGPALGTNFLELPDGAVLGLGFKTKRLADGVFEVPLLRSRDGGKTFKSSTARLNIPEGTGGTGDDGKRYEGPAVDHALVRCRDGSLLAAMYGSFKTDTVLCPTFPPEWKLYKYRTFVVRSTDGGATWDYWATVAYDPDVGLESFCEADLLQVPNGDLLCFMRTGGSGGKYTPLYLGTSHDAGKTWDKPHPIADRGVWPNACRLQSGVLVVTYGRPDNYLAFSLDDGKTWTGHTCFYRGPTTSYNSVEEVEPGKLLVVYDRQALDADGNMARGVVGVPVSVERR